MYINWNEDADYYSDCSDISIASSIEDFCPIHGKSTAVGTSTTIRSHPAVKRNSCLTRKDSGLPDSPNDPFACKRDLQCNKSNCLLDETDV